YLAALLGNCLIFTTIACDHHLHTPMYFFLLNLSILDLASISTTLLGSRACVHMAAAAWGAGFLSALLHTANTFSLPLCQGNAVEQFFCEIPQILKLSCSHSELRDVGLLDISVFLLFGCFVFIVVSYVQIFRAVLRIPSEQGRHKAFSTCLPHLAMVSLFVSTGAFAYLKTSSTSSPSLHLVLSVLYSVVPPAVNPLIYSLRNQQLKDAVWKLITGWFSDAMNCLSSSA
ncbi:olfactory receptor 14A16-like, partial [Cuculus canorus]|uniref:olfactory receptor 14A16-like n=1 Tax=Cuculus canorus TaxID=55661 RepID=UPI0023AB285D